MAEVASLCLVHLFDVRSIRAVEEVHSYPRRPTKGVAAHDVSLQRIGNVRLELVRTVVLLAGSSPELRIYPVLQHSLATHTCGDIAIPITLERSRGESTFRISNLFSIRLIAKSQRRTQDVCTLVRTVERTVAVVVEVQPSLKPPLRRKPICRIYSGTEVN